MESKRTYCKFCGKVINPDCIFCPECGKKIAEPKNTNDIIDNPSMASTASSSTTSINSNIRYKKSKNKWISLLLCLFLGIFGVHKFYEEKIGIGILYLFTGGLFCIGWIVDIISLLMKPNPYYV